MNIDRLRQLAVGKMKPPLDDFQGAIRQPFLKRKYQFLLGRDAAAEHSRPAEEINDCGCRFHEVLDKTIVTITLCHLSQCNTRAYQKTNHKDVKAPRRHGSCAAVVSFRGSSGTVGGFAHNANRGLVAPLSQRISRRL